MWGCLKAAFAFAFPSLTTPISTFLQGIKSLLGENPFLAVLFSNLRLALFGDLINNLASRKN